MTSADLGVDAVGAYRSVRPFEGGTPKSDTRAHSHRRIAVTRVQEEAISTFQRRTRSINVLFVTIALIAAGCGGGGDTSTLATIDSSVPSSSAGPTISTLVPTSEAPSPADPSTTTSAPAPTTSLSTVTTTGPIATSTSVPATTVAATTTAPLPVGLDGWPAVPADNTEVDDLPRLLPGRPIDGVDDAIRNEYAGDPNVRPSYQQIWVSAEDDALFQIATYPTVGPYPTPGAQAVDIAPWTTALSGPAGEGYAFVTLIDGDGYVWVSGQNLTDEQIIVAARSMTRRSGGAPGWDIEPPTEGLQLIGEGWNSRFVGRNVNWYDDNQLAAEISIVHGKPEQLTYGPGPYTDSDITIVDVDGVPAVVRPLPYEHDPVTLVLWSPEPDLVVYLGVRAPTDEAIAIARALQSVDQATWESVSRPPDNRSDGCQSFLC